MQEPIERLEEIINHPADKTLHALQSQSFHTKKELSQERHELSLLSQNLPSTPPPSNTPEHTTYLQLQSQLDALRKKISQTHNELMEILKTEERISREISNN
jgi:hypothetical protein